MTPSMPRVRRPRASSRTADRRAPSRIAPDWRSVRTRCAATGHRLRGLLARLDDARLASASSRRSFARDTSSSRVVDAQLRLEPQDRDLELVANVGQLLRRMLDREDSSSR